MCQDLENRFVCDFLIINSFVSNGMNKRKGAGHYPKMITFKALFLRKEKEKEREKKKENKQCFKCPFSFTT
jgi:hypothetical protein